MPIDPVNNVNSSSGRESDPEQGVHQQSYSRQDSGQHADAQNLVESDGQNNVLSAWLPKDNKGILNLNPSSEDYSQKIMEAHNEAMLRKYRPTQSKIFWSWVSVILGVMFLLSWIIPSDANNANYIQAFFMGITGAIWSGSAGAYWLYRNKKDKNAIIQWAKEDLQYREALQNLSEDDKNFLAPRQPMPVIEKRNWPVVWFIIAASVIIFAIISPSAT